MTLATEETAVPPLMSDRRLEKILSTGQRMNELRSKIHLATERIRDASPGTNLEDDILRRESLRGELEQDFARAKELMPVVHELVSEFEGQIKLIESTRKLHEEVMRIEQASPISAESGAFEGAGAADAAQVAELESLVSALTELGKDITSRTAVVSCPRCHSKDVTYTITPSEFGFSIYKCRECSNAWRIQQFSLQIG